MATQSQSQFFSQLKRYYSFYTGGFVAFVIIIAILEQMGVPNKILGYIFGLDVGGQLHRYGRHSVSVRL